MDQSLRTVATQLLNVTNPEDTVKPQKPEKNEVSLVKEVNSEISNLESMGVGFGRPVNSKYGYFENSHPGQAMAITEEELEREMSSTRVMTAYKNHPTTTGGISTWILLNQPSTTVRSTESEKKKQKEETEARTTARPTTTMERVETTVKVIEKLTPSASSTVHVEKPTSKKPLTLTTRRPSGATKSGSTQNAEVGTSTEALRGTTVSSVGINEAASSSVSTSKKSQVVRTTPKPKVTTPKSSSSKAGSTKPFRQNQQGRPKPATRRTTAKPEAVKDESASTAKIEKVTFRPIQMITTPKTKAENTEKPMFVTKIKASILMDTQKSASTPTTSTVASTTTRTTASSTELVTLSIKPKPASTKVNNVLKVQLKKPVDETTQIVIEPIRVNTPVLTIEELKKDGNTAEEMIDKDIDVLENSKIDVKFDFDPELTRINVETSTEPSTTTSTASTSTTKRPRQNSKRKKNKVRRRKPSTAATSSTTTIAPISSSTESETSTEVLLGDSEILESKNAPESKIASNSTKKKTAKPTKPLTTQLYNFLSRDVMPSFGVVSLLGLGLGLASYFLYPFGGTIARRNYEVEPKYKYNLDEYGGNYGQNEEEVLLKVLQGMTDNKYPDTKHYDNNYYRYKNYGHDEAYTSRKPDSRYPSASPSPVYRNDGVGSSMKYQNTDYRYQDGPTTPNYYDKAKDPSNSVNRQFVVGNVPKEYPYYGEKYTTLSTPTKISGHEATEGSHSEFPNYNYPTNSVNAANYGYQEGENVRVEDEYEEIEITPTAVAVEHGPRSLKKRSVDDASNLGNHLVPRQVPRVKRYVSEEGLRVFKPVRSSRSRRESVIQVIPSKRELEEEEKEEDLSNEIFDIIDSAIPEVNYEKTTNRREDNEVEGIDAEKVKKDEEETTRPTDTKAKTTENTKVDAKDVTTEESISSTTKDDSDSSVGTTRSTTSSTKDTTEKSEGSSTTEDNTIDWINLTTKPPPKPEGNNFNFFSFVKKVAEIKFRLGLTLLKHASEGFARYLGHVQKRINGDE